MTEPTDREMELALRFVSVWGNSPGKRQALAMRLAEYREEIESRMNSCEVCKVCLEPQQPRCKAHFHTEPGEDGWED